MADSGEYHFPWVTSAAVLQEPVMRCATDGGNVITEQAEFNVQLNT